MPKTYSVITLLGLLLTGCRTVGPDYRPPAAAVPAAFKHVDAAMTAAAQPLPTPGAWWTVFNDPQLNALEDAALAHNPTLVSAAARVAETRSQLGLAQAGLTPDVNLNANVQLDGQTATQYITVFGNTFGTRQKGQSYSVPLSASYELDLWGRVRRSIESANAQVAASEADSRAVALTLTANLAQSYFQFRALAGEIAVVQHTITVRTDALDVENERFAAGLIQDFDAVSAREELATAQADLSDLLRQQEETVDAIANLTGQAPSDFAFTAPKDDAPLPPPPVIPAGLPSTLIQRRPDIVEAERTLAARTASIGVAEAAKFPTVELTGTAGFQSMKLLTLLNSSSQLWNIGPSVSLPIFDGGRNDANIASARAQADAALADYQTQVLTAFREVEDALVDLNRQAEQAAAQDRAEAASSEAAEISRLRYDRGLENYLQVVDTERDLLSNERTQVQIAGARYLNTVKLIQALGGGWN